MEHGQDAAGLNNICFGFHIPDNPQTPYADCNGIADGIQRALCLDQHAGAHPGN